MNHKLHRNLHLFVSAAIVLVALFPLGGVAQTAPNGPAPAVPATQTGGSAPDIIAFLNQTIAWYRHLPVEQQLATEPGDLLYLNDDQQLAAHIARLSFDFARARAAALGTEATAGQSQAPGQEGIRYQSLVDLAAKAELQVKSAQQQLDAMRLRLVTATGRRREELQSAISEQQSELELAETRRDVMRNMVEFVSGANASGASGGLQSQIDELERTIPAETKSGTQNSRSENGSNLASLAHKPEPSGILALITDLIALSRKGHTLDDTIELTDALAQASKSLRSPMGASLRELTKRGDQLANQPASTDPTVLAQQKKQLDALTAEFKQRSEAVLPLVKQRVLLDLYKRSLTNWRASVRNQYTSELKNLVLRLAVLAVVLALVVGFSEVWRKAIFKYVRDTRRRYQLLLVRRIVLWFMIAVIVAFAFATELGSLATFAGLLTAGVAVALQNVILSIAGYFFLIGKYGVRVGDRVQVSGVTGEVVDIGLVRLHLMELGSGSSTAQPTGRVVVFSNSVVFQPSGGLFKQIPGTSFVWHEITLTLAPESNYRGVEERLSGAVDAVFAEYHEKMESQSRHIERALGSVAVESLHPLSRLRLTQTGLEVVIRYPVELDEAANIDDRITREVLDAINREPKLKLVGTGTPNIQEVQNEPAAERSR